MPEEFLDSEGYNKLVIEHLSRSREQNALPLLDRAGNVTSETFDRRAGAPEGQPNPQRLTLHLDYLNRNDPNYVPQAGQPIPDFQVADPFKSEGLLDSIGNTLKLAGTKTIEADIYRVFSGEDVDLGVAGFQPNRFENIAAEVLSFFSPASAGTLVVGGGIGGAIVKKALQTAIKKKITAGLSQKLAEAAVKKEFSTIVGRIASSVPPSAGALGGYEAVRGALHTKIQTGEFDLGDALRDGLEGMALGASLGFTGGALAPLGAGTVGITRALSVTGKFAAEAVTLGGVAPLLEGRTPTLEDFKHSAEFLLALKVAHKAQGKVVDRIFGDKEVKEKIEEIQTRVEKGEDHDAVMIDLLEGAAEAGGVGVAELAKKAARDQRAKLAKKRIKEKVPSGKDDFGKIDHNKKFANRETNVEVFGKYNPEMAVIKSNIKGKNKKRLLIAEGKSLSDFNKVVDYAKKNNIDLVVGQTFEKSPLFQQVKDVMGRRQDKFLMVTGKAELPPIDPSLAQTVPIREKGKVEAVPNKSNWRESFEKEKDPSVKADILRAIADISKSKKELSDILERVEGLPEESNIRHAVELKLKSLSSSKEPKTIKVVKVPALQIPKGGFTRATFQKQMKEAFKLPESESSALNALADARAATFAKETGKTPNEWYSSRIAQIRTKEVFGVAKGSISFQADGKAVIRAFEGADISTASHELAHIFRRELKTENLKVAEKWAGVKKGEWTKEAEELFANGFERYLIEGKAPTKPLEAVFERFRQFLRTIYRKIKGSEIDIKLSPEIIKTFDSLIDGAKPKEIKPPTTAKGLTDVLFQERAAVKSMGQKALDWWKEKQEALSPFVQPLITLSKRLKSESGQKLSKEAGRANHIYHSTNNKYAEFLGENLIPKKMTDAQGDKLGRDIQDPKVKTPEAEAFTDMLRDDYINAIQEHLPKKKPDDILPRTPNYFRRLFKREVNEEFRASLKVMNEFFGDVKFENASNETVRDMLRSKKMRGLGFTIVKDTGRTVFESTVDYIIENNKSPVRNKKMSFRKAIQSLEREMDNGDLFIEAGFTKKRTLKLPSDLYETNAKIVLHRMAEAVAKKVAEIKVFGPKGEKALELLSKIKKENFEEYELALKGLTMWSGVYYQKNSLSPVAKRASDLHTAFQVGGKIGLGRAPILNAFQWAISIFPKFGAYPTVSGLIDTFNPAKRAFIKSKGVVDGYEGLAFEAVTGQKLPGGRFGKFAEFTTKWSGFNAINRLNLYWAAASYMRAVEQWIPQARKSGRLAEIRKSQLKAFGIDYKKDFNKDQLAEGMFKFAQDSQLIKNVFNEPIVFGDPRVKPFILFKRFGFKQFIFMKDMLTSEFKRGNYMPAIRLALAGYAGGEAVIWSLNQIQSILSGEDVYRKDEKFLRRTIENISVLGAFGIATDMAEAQRLSKVANKIKFTLYPVFLSDFEKFLDNWTAFSSDWENYGDVFLATKRNAFRGFGFFGSYPRYVGERLKTQGQVDRKITFKKGVEKREIYDLLLNADNELASKRVKSWNENNPSNPITYNDVSLSAIIKYLERQMKRKIEVDAKKNTPEFREAKRREDPILRRKINELKQKFNGPL